MTSRTHHLTPHNAGASPKLPEGAADIFAENHEAFAADDYDGLRNRVLCRGH